MSTQTPSFHKDEIDEILTRKFSELGSKDQQVVIFLYEWDRPIRPGDMKKYIKVPHSTLNSVIKRLVSNEIVDWEEYGLVNLKPIGKKMAAHHLKHHIIIHHYFEKALGLPTHEAHEEGLKASGVLSCKTIQIMKSKIPDCDLGPCGIYYSS